VRFAVFSDVHGNLPALEAVRVDLSRVPHDQVLCLGDLVGYGASPAACIALVLDLADVVLAGNHDVDVTREQAASGTNSQARELQAWTRVALSPAELAILAALPWRHVETGQLMAVHGSYVNPEGLTGYVTSTMLEENLRAALAQGGPPLAVCGHTHVPLCGWLEGDALVEPKASGKVVWPRLARAVLVNPGAVGQPRDGDPRAAWALVDTVERTVEFRRVPYDIERAVRDLATAGLPPALGERLRAGR
jgi:diadenosine tetraphosphatase ApaH/serine/threonine PP2A family protein phosphatase